MKSILISIKPKYVADILNGKKTIEIRKTMPKCDLPIDVYIYCTKDKKNANLINRGGFLTGMVVAKFTLNKVEEINRYCTGKGISYKTETLNDIELCDKSCLDLIEIDHYLYFKKGCAIHISNLEVFDKPKELSEFYKFGFNKAMDDFMEKELKEPPYPLSCRLIEKQYQLTKAPQSWCYVEVLQ